MHYIPQDSLSAVDPRHRVDRWLADGLHSQRLARQTVLERSVALLEQVGLDGSYLDVCLPHSRAVGGSASPSRAPLLQNRR